MSKRIVALDLLKLVAIFLVLYGHALQHLVSVDKTDIGMFRFITSFHMPLFMAISGYFAASSIRFNFKNFVLRKGCQLLVPAIAGSIIVSGIYYLLDADVNYKELIIYGLWFLRSLFICSVLFFIAAKRTKYVAVWLVITLIISQIVPYLHLPWMYPAFLLGAAIKHWSEWFKRHSTILMIATAISFVWMFPELEAKHYQVIKTSDAVLKFFNGDSSMLCQLLAVRGFRIALGSAATTFLILAFMRFTHNTAAAKWLSQFGTYTLGVYVLQTFVLEAVIHQFVNFDCLPLWVHTYVAAPLVAAGVLILTLWLSKLCERNKFTALIFLGKVRADTDITTRSNARSLDH